MTTLDIKDLIAAYSSELETLSRTASERFGPDGEKLREALTEVLNGYLIAITTDWNYSNCYSFSVLLHKHVEYPHLSQEGELNLLKQLDGRAYRLNIDCAYIRPYYFLSYFQSELVVYISPDGEEQFECDGSTYLKPACEEHLALESQVRACLESLGFSPISEEVLQIEVPEITLELASGDGSVPTVYNVLFHDEYGGYKGTRALPDDGEATTSWVAQAWQNIMARVKRLIVRLTRASA